MIVVDSSVWIAKFRDIPNDAVAKLNAIRETDEIAVGDIVLLEVLQGTRDERHAARLEAALRTFTLVRMIDFDLARQAAINFRRLRAMGVTLRATTDLIIGTYCIEHGDFLLHHDRDFKWMEEYLGLKVL
jgi:predicted nucleic acid-binding protein